MNVNSFTSRGAAAHTESASSKLSVFSSASPQRSNTSFFKYTIARFFFRHNRSPIEECTMFRRFRSAIMTVGCKKRLQNRSKFKSHDDSMIFVKFFEKEIQNRFRCGNWRKIILFFSRARFPIKIVPAVACVTLLTIVSVTIDSSDFSENFLPCTIKKFVKYAKRVSLKKYSLVTGRMISRTLLQTYITYEKGMKMLGV